MKVLAYTGTQGGMTPPQAAGIRWLVDMHEPAEVRHGDCVGGDAQFDAICRRDVRIRFAIHPGARLRDDGTWDESKRAFCARPGDLVFPVKAFLDRNDDIVAPAERLLAAPKGFVQARRSGTWATVRRAVNALIPVTIVLPDGSMESR